jgi:hypothetical protein
VGREEPGHDDLSGRIAYRPAGFILVNEILLKG